MKTFSTLLLLATTLFTGGALTRELSAPVAPVSAATAVGSPQRDRDAPLRWGIGFEMDRPFYTQGDTAMARFILSNASGMEAYGGAPVGGGNGCQFSVAIENRTGDVVWQAGRIRQGMYSGQPCLFREITWSLLSHSTESQELFVPLIYLNNNGIGQLGSDLPPGAYALTISVTFAGPKRAPWLPAFGRNFSSTVPFLIEA